VALWRPRHGQSVAIAVVLADSAPALFEGAHYRSQFLVVARRSLLGGRRGALALNDALVIDLLRLAKAAGDDAPWGAHPTP